MRKFTIILPVATVFFAGACDELELADAPDRGEGDISFRPSGTSGIGGGSTLLNTGRLHFSGLPVHDFHRHGEQRAYEDPQKTRVTFRGVRIREGNGMMEFTAGGSDIRALPNGLQINGVYYYPGRLVGSEWRFQVSSSTLEPREVMIRLNGAALAEVPGGTTVPLYNFSLEGAGPFDELNQVCKPVDVVTQQNVLYWPAEAPGGVESNQFNFSVSALLYPDIRVSNTGEVTQHDTSIYLACASGAIGKAALWGYPPWVPAYQGMNGIQQLQQASRVIRADFCGDGTPHTQDGTPIQIRDRFRSDFDDAYEATEAIWDATRTACRVTRGRVEPVADYTCGGAVTTDCKQLASNWILGSQRFMWTKVGPDTTPASTKTDCAIASNTPGCDDPGVEAVVCAQDSYCCQWAWDWICVNEVTSFNAASEACCVDNGGPGCGSPTVTSCVGAHDSYCTNARWDSWCALEVEHLGCGMCG